MTSPTSWNRRHFLGMSGLGAAAALAGCASEPGAPGTTGSAAPAPTSGGTSGAPTSGGGATDGPPEDVFKDPATKVSGSLSILLWSHFVPSHDTWFDKFAAEWGKKVGVDVRVDHIAVGDIPAQISSEIQAGSGHDLIQYIATCSQWESGLMNLQDVNDECNKRHGEILAISKESSYNPHTDYYYALAPGWAPDPGDYRKSLWEPVGFADGPKKWDDLVTGGGEIKKSQGIQLGLGMSQEIDSNMVSHALMWSYGGSVQDANEKVILDSPETVAAVEFMTKLFKAAMTPEVFSWNAASNNQGLIAGKLSYILNSISAYRSAQTQNPEVAEDVHFVKALEGPAGAFAAQHALYNWIVPKHSKNPDAAKEFLLAYVDNFASATYASQLYDFPSWASLVPQLPGWLENDPFGSKPADKLSFFEGTDEAATWSASIGHPGPSSPAVGEVIGTYMIPNMFAAAAKGDKTPAQSVKDTAVEVEKIFAKWRERGLVGG